MTGLGGLIWRGLFSEFYSRLFHTLINSLFYLCNFSSTFFYEQKKTNERSVPAIIVSFAK